MDYSDKNVRSIAKVAYSAFTLKSDDILRPMTTSVQEVVYYVGGWTLHAMKKIAIRRVEKFAVPIMFLVNLCSITSEVANSMDLPTGKTDRVQVFGGLSYPDDDYFELILRIEDVFANTLTKEYLMVYGSEIIEKIRNALLDNTALYSIVESLLPVNCDGVIVKKIIYYLVSIYSRMRGKDYAYKLFEKGSTLKVTTRTKCAVLSNKETYTKKEKKDKNEFTESYKVFNEVSEEVLEEVLNE